MPETLVDGCRRLAGIKDFHWHDFRHTFATRLRQKGTTLEDTADLLGHKGLAVTRCYAHISTDRLQEAVSRLSAAPTATTTTQGKLFLLVGLALSEVSLLLSSAYQANGGARGPVTLPVFKAGDPSLCGVDGGFDSHTLPPKSR